jgi:NAD(P)-dependent dehydrogenase (short-subunit alcohol dehydrogenase family)
MTSAEPRRVLVAGGTGVFGERLVARLLGTTGFGVIAGARDSKRLAALATRHTTNRLTALTLDVTAVTPKDLRRTGAGAADSRGGAKTAVFYFDGFVSLAATGLITVVIVSRSTVTTTFGAI